jgi:hypothetical protein
MRPTGALPVFVQCPIDQIKVERVTISADAL